MIGIVATDMINVCSQTRRTVITQLQTNAQQTWPIERFFCDYYEYYFTIVAFLFNSFRNFHKKSQAHKAYVYVTLRYEYWYDKKY